MSFNKDKKGWPIERVKGRPFYNFFRTMVLNVKKLLPAEVRVGQAGFYESDEQRRHLEEEGQKCRFGRNWWVWLPYTHRRHGSFSVMWLCYWIEFID